MKDFDFDELDRAVSSVLTQKQAQANQTTDANDDTPHDDQGTSQPTDATTTGDTVSTTSDGQVTDDVHDVPVVADADEQSGETIDVASHDQPETDSDTSSVGDSEVASDSSEVTDSSEPEASTSDVMEAPESDIVKVENTPQRRGRFMDVVRPSADMTTAHKPISTHGGVTISPSSDFKIDEKPSESEVVAEPTTQPSMDEEVVEPSTGEQQADVSDDATGDEPVVEETDTNESRTDGIMTPFIPDVPVEKRPLNALSSSDISSANSTASAASPEPDSMASPVSTEPSAPLPKEFDSAVMAVEANETIGSPSESTPSQEDAPTESTPAVAEAATIAAAPFIAQQYHAAEDKTDTEAHPVFDAGSYHQPLTDTTKHKTSLPVVIVIVAVLLLVGAALGVLYFLYGQQ